MSIDLNAVPLWKVVLFFKAVGYVSMRVLVTFPIQNLRRLLQR